MAISAVQAVIDEVRPTFEELFSKRARLAVAALDWQSSRTTLDGVDGVCPIQALNYLDGKITQQVLRVNPGSASGALTSCTLYGKPGLGVGALISYRDNRIDLMYDWQIEIIKGIDDLDDRIRRQDRIRADYVKFVGLWDDTLTYRERYLPSILGVV